MTEQSRQSCSGRRGGPGGAGGAVYGLGLIGALVYYIKAVPGIVPVFPVDGHASTLLQLHSRLESSGSLTFKAGSYLIEAHKPE